MPTTKKTAHKSKLFSSERVAELIKECAEAQGVDPSEIAWLDFQTWVRETNGDVKTLQSSLSKIGGYNAIRDSFYPPKPTLKNQEKRIIGRHALVNRREGRAEADKELVLAQIEEFAKKVFKGRVAGFKPRAQKKAISRSLNLVLSDLHIGSDLIGALIDGEDYGVEEEARAIAKICLETANYKPQYREETELFVAINGDVIENLMHDIRDGANLSEQICRAIHILIQALAYLCSAFPRVHCYWTTGNHDRILQRHPKRATSSKADSYGTVIGFAVKSALARLTNLTFEIPLTPWAEWREFGWVFFSTHSDNVISHGYPGSSISTKLMTQCVDTLNSGLKEEDQADCVIVGHTHTSFVTQLSNCVWFVNNGSTKPADGYTVSTFGRRKGTPRAQTLFETTEQYPVGDVRFLQVDASTSRDASLDKIIQPFRKF